MFLMFFSPVTFFVVSCSYFVRYHVHRHSILLTCWSHRATLSVTVFVPLPPPSVSPHSKTRSTRLCGSFLFFVNCQNIHSNIGHSQKPYYFGFFFVYHPCSIRRRFATTLAVTLHFSRRFVFVGVDSFTLFRQLKITLHNNSYTLLLKSRFE